MATENIMMTATKEGANRQKIHEKLRKYCIMASYNINKKGEENNLIKMLLEDEDLNLNKEQLNSILKPKNFIGLSSSQVENFLKNVINPILNNYELKNENLEKFELLV